MKKVVFGLFCLFLASQMFVSCSSESDVMSQFSKRKYLKKFKSKNVKYEENVNPYDNNLEYASAEEVNVYSDEPVDYQLEEIEAIDNSVMIEFPTEKIQSIAIANTTTPKDYSDWNKYNRKINFSNLNNDFNKNNVSINNNQASEILIGIFCFFIPFVGVLLYEGDVSTNFWITLIGTLLFWLPGMVLAFLICFGGVSF